jgi:hypothetical protein
MMSSRLPHSSAHRFTAARLLAVALAGTLAACVSGEANNGLADRFPPTISLSAGTVSDSQMTFNVGATDNLGLLNVDAVAGAPGISAICDTTFNTAVTSFTRLCTISIPSTVPLGTTVTVLAQSVDGNHNLSPVDTLLMVTGGGSPAIVVLTQPKVTPRDTVPVGFTSAISISGRARAGVLVLGWQITGVFPGTVRDSVVYSSPLKDSLSLDTAQDYTGATPGLGTMTPFMYDSLGRLYVGPAVQFQVVASAGSNTRPVVNFGITKRVEVTDTVHVTATDRAGVAVMGYVIRQMPPNQNTIISRDSVIIAGNVSTSVKTFTMALPITTFPTQVLVEAFATNKNGAQDSARIPVGNTGVIRTDTVTVVAGLTRPLPNGGAVADGIYHAPTNRIYLSNIENNTIEIFNLGDSSFKTPIPVGSRPWGVAIRPADHTGAETDTLIVANSGGTLISFVDVTTGNEHEVYRYALPNLIFFTVTSAVLPNGVLVQHRKQHDFSDRPQFVAATCTGVGAGACVDLRVGYTTTPTAGQTLPFTNQGTIRYEDITQRQSHFFFEQAIGQSDLATIDTIVVERLAAGGYGTDSTLVPFVQGPFITGVDTSFFAVTTNTPLIGFRDTTFTRNSGNFQRAVFGEGGRVGTVSGQPNARAMTYDVNPGMVTSFTSKGHTYTAAANGFIPVFDGGISRPVDVSDFVANTSTSVSGVAINFDGATSDVRADSTYLFDLGLRLQGLLQTSAGNSGADFHPLNFGVPRPGLTGGTQMMFTASSSPEIQVWNTNTYQLCLSVPTRDPVIGPIKSALVAGGATMIVGATQYGVVVVTIPQAQMTAACP